ncbi:MAG TPA: class I SAM-dependent methyltransferase [Vicinamibacterales bacterium]|nr:class I SAM-dependent methyltransferase [Vicinamibacterales bacterium]
MTSETTARTPAATEAFQRDRLAHVLPDFTRISWVNDRAREVWEPRISRIGSAWAQIEWRSVEAGIRRCALTSVPSEQLVARSMEWAARGLSMMPVAMSGTSPGYASTSIAPRVGEPFEYRVAIGALADVAELKRAIDGGGDGTMGRLLGFPDCCIAFFRKTWVEEGCVDTTWAMAANSGRVDDTGRLIEIDADTPFQANILWRWVGPRAVPHLPCSFSCQATVRLADTLRAFGRQAGYGAEMDWLEEILSWPASWSALHGIAEVKTPVLKVSTRTDATAHEFVVRRQGPRLPAEAVAGLGFPFRPPERPGITHSLAFRKGLEAPITLHKELPEWYAGDNGFSARAAMDEAHRPIVELAVTSLGDSGTVIDLGCGNGALLKKICEARTGVIPFGMDVDESKLEHARLLQPAFSANFIAGNMFERIPVDPDTVYSLIILMPGRLLEVDETSGRRLREWLRGHFNRLLVYGYGEWLTRYDGLSGLAARAGLTLESVHKSGTAALARIAD